MTATATKTRTTEIRDGYKLETIPMQGGVWRVDLIDNETNRFLNRRKDLDWSRVEEIKNLLVAEENARRSPEPKTIDPNSLTVRYFRATKTRQATTEQLQAARTLLTAEYDALATDDRDGTEGTAYELAIQTILIELTARGH